MRNLEDFAGIASDWFWETDAEHRFTYFSARMEQVTNMRPEDIIGKRRDQQRLICSENSDFEDHLDDLRNHRPFRNFEYKIKRQLSDGYLWLRIAGDPVFDADGHFQGYRGTGHDITPEKEAMERLAAVNDALAARNRELDALRQELELAAFEDALTGLPNRRAFDLALAEGLSTDRCGLALLLIDLDRFKWVNDTLGHPAGDMVLMTTAERLAALCCHRSKAYRIGGDEFGILMTQCTNPSLANDLGKRIVRTLRETITFDQQEFGIGASVGYSVTHGIPTSRQRLFSNADAALYDAKNAGRNCVKPSARRAA